MLSHDDAEIPECQINLVSCVLCVNQSRHNYRGLYHGPSRAINTGRQRDSHHEPIAHRGYAQPHLEAAVPEQARAGMRIREFRAKQRTPPCRRRASFRHVNHPPPSKSVRKPLRCRHGSGTAGWQSALSSSCGVVASSSAVSKPKY